MAGRGDGVGAGKGAATIASDVPDYRKIVQPGEAGLLVPPWDVVALAGAVSALLALGPDARRSLEV